MIKGLLERKPGLEGPPLVLLGLSHENVSRLFADEPLRIRLSAPPPEGVGLPDAPDLFIIVGPDEEAMLAMLQNSKLGETLTDDKIHRVER